jgi:hypothetical protein
MNPYAIVGSGVGTADAASLCTRLTAWHDAMVAHERRLRTRRMRDLCGEDCPHAEARALWADALAIFGTRAQELTFLRSRGMSAARPSEDAIGSADGVSEAAHSPRQSNREIRKADEARRGGSLMNSSNRPHTTTAEVWP